MANLECMPRCILPNLGKLGKGYVCIPRSIPKPQPFPHHVERLTTLNLKNGKPRSEIACEGAKSPTTGSRVRESKGREESFDEYLRLPTSTYWDRAPFQRQARSGNAMHLNALHIFLLPKEISPAGAMVARKTLISSAYFPMFLWSLEVVGSSPTLGAFFL